METLLKVAGIAVLAVLALILVAVLVAAILMRKVKRWAGQAALAALPDEITVSPVEEPDWEDPGRVAELGAALERLGYERAGLHEVDEMPDVSMAAFVLPAESLVAVVTEHAGKGSWVDLGVESPDGRCVSYTSTSQGSEVKEPPWKRTVRRPGASVEALDAEFRDDLPAERNPVRAEDFKELFERFWARTMQWHSDRGGPTAGEVDAVARGVKS